MRKLKPFDRRRSYNVAQYFVYAMGGLFFAALALYLFLTFYPFKTIKVFNSPMPVLNAVPIRTGETVFYEVHFCKYTRAAATTFRQLEGSGPENNKLIVGGQPSGATADRTKYGDVKFRTNDAGEKVYDFPCNETNPVIRQSGAYIIPANVPAGTYRLRIVARYQVNPIREIPYEFFTKEFVVEDGATRNPAPRPNNLSIVNIPPLPQQEIKENGNKQITPIGEVILEPVAPLEIRGPAVKVPDAKVKIETPLVDVDAEAKTKIVEPEKQAKKEGVCLPLNLGCIKL